MSNTWTFVALGALLVVLVAAVLLRPLWRDTRNVAIGVAVWLGLSAFALYRIVGTPAALDAQANVAMPETLDDAIKELQAALKKDPTQAEGWRLLGQSLGSSERYAESRDAYAQAAKLLPNDADVLVEAAQARALADPQHRFDVQSVAMLRHALEAQPQHQRARWFLGIAQRQAGDDKGAAETWEPLLAMVDANTGASLRAQIDDARKAAGLAPLPKPAVAASEGGLRVRVALDPDLAARARLRGDATVFVIARAAGGPPMPIAVERHTLQELPLDIVLDDGDSPMPTAKLSAMKDVEVLARISPSGDAIPQAGDLESKPAQVTLPAQAPVDLTIGTVHE